MLEAIKRAGGDPPVRKGAGYNGVYTAERGNFILKNFPERIFKQDARILRPAARQNGQRGVCFTARFL